MNLGPEYMLTSVERVCPAVNETAGRVPSTTVEPEEILGN